MSDFTYTDDNELSYQFSGWYIKYHTPFLKNQLDFKNSDYDIEKTRNSTSISCFCRGYGDDSWESICEWQIPNSHGYLFDTKEEALRRFNILVKNYGKNLKFEDIFVEVCHCKIEQKFTYLPS